MHAGKKIGGFIVVPHPFDATRSRISHELERIKNFIDAVEVINSRCISVRFNQKALEFAQKNKLPIIAGSDSHFSYEIGSAYTLIRTEKNRPSEREIFSAIKKGDTVVMGASTGLKPHISTFIYKLSHGKGPV